MAQVKFYSTSAADYAAQVTADTVNGGGVYFVDGGELYKGTQRFGLGRVTVDAEFNPSTSTKDGQARGDIVVTGTGAGWVFNGTSWISIGGDIGTITSAWRADISTWTAGLASGTTGSYIEYIEQAADGKVTAHAAPFNTKVLEAVGNGSATSTANGITVDVVTTSGSVTSVSVSAANITATSVTADTGTFTNLTVSDTATFNATTVSASTLTVGGVAVDNVAASTATSSASGVAVTVSTANGGVKDVDVAVTGNLATFAGKSVVTAIADASTASDANIPTEAAVRAALNNFDNAMHFRGVVASTSDVTSPASGDIVVIGAEPTSGAVVGQEYIYNGSAWELIGDQNSYALNAYAPGTEIVTASVTTLPAATHAIASKVDDIAAALSDFTYSSVTGGTDSSTVNGVTVEVVTAATTAVPTVSLTGVGTAASKNYADSLTAAGTSLPTESAVAAYVSGVVEGLDANVSSSNQTGLTVSVAQADGVVTGVQAELVWLGADGTALA